MIDKNRMLAITDGIIAVAATVMVLQLDVPDRASMAAVQAQFPTLVAYIISYMQIFLAWHEHHDAFATAEIINHRVYLLNCLWLFFVTLLPFVTGVVGKSPTDQASVLMYILILCMESLLLKWECTTLERLNHSVTADIEIIWPLRRVTFLGYAFAAVCTFFMPLASLVLIVGICVVNVILVCLYDRKLPGHS